MEASINSLGSWAAFQIGAWPHIVARKFVMWTIVTNSLENLAASFLLPMKTKARDCKNAEEQCKQHKHRRPWPAFLDLPVTMRSAINAVSLVLHQHRQPSFMQDLYKMHLSSPQHPTTLTWAICTVVARVFRPSYHLHLFNTATGP